MSADDTRLSVIAGVCQHDPERWRQFDAIYRPMLFAYMRKRGLKEFEANDLVQDIFVKLLTKINTYSREKCSFRSWLFNVAQNALIDRARRRASYRRAVEGWALRVIRASPAENLKMAEEWVKIHREQILEHALKTTRACTSPKQWACFEERLLRDRSAAEIALELKLDPGVVYVNASRVLKQVRACCEQFDEDLGHALESHVSS